MIITVSLQDIEVFLHNLNERYSCEILDVAFCNMVHLKHFGELCVFLWRKEVVDLLKKISGRLYQL